MNNRAIVFLGGLAVLVVLGSFSIFTVKEWEKAVLFQLGEVKRTDIAPGIHFKLPFVNNVRQFDGRVLSLDAETERFLTKEKKNVSVDAFVKWRIIDVATFYTSTGGNEARANVRLSQIIRDSLKSQFGLRNIQEVVSGERLEIMSIVQMSANREAEKFGIEVVDVRLRRIDLPEEVSESVYSRMRAERTRIAKELRSKGAEAAERIRADADRQRVVTLADAFRDAERLRGEGDAESAEIYAKAYKKNEEFYSFYRSLNAYKSTFRGKDDVLVIEPGSDFFKYFKNPLGKQK
ncbi:MAG: membrane protease subunit HflC [Gammaproteobacteria bacterium]|nr:MAG: membrane protease subunit HflC [Gammaproteobacteria bacterium]TND01744.1 MAG: membrane protease subunit HflC [Gammaproteobacteria bacterium]